MMLQQLRDHLVEMIAMILFIDFNAAKRIRVFFCVTVFFDTPVSRSFKRYRMQILQDMLQKTRAMRCVSDHVYIDQVFRSQAKFNFDFLSDVLLRFLRELRSQI